MMSSSVAIEILFITNIGSISSKMIAGVEKCQIVIFFIENLLKYLKCTAKHSVKDQISIDTENKIMQSRAENWTEHNAMKMIRLQYTLAFK